MVDAAERQRFAERVQLQLRSRYRGVEVVVDAEAFSLRLRGAGADVSLALGPLHQTCLRAPGRCSTLIAEFVHSAERQLSPRTGPALDPAHLTWCVRGVRYLQSLSRATELVSRPLGAGMTAFVAEVLPGSQMRGVAQQELVEAWIDEPSARDHADVNTEARFAALPERIRAAERIPADGWRLTSDNLFQGSVLLVPSILAAFVERSGGDVLLAVPDRGEVLALPARLPSVDRFRMRVVRSWREAMNPVSRDILVTDGASLTELERGPRRGGFELLGWLRG